MHKILLAALGLTGMALNLVPSAQTYDMKDPKGVSAVSFTVESPLEPIKGQSNAISGDIVFDAAAPEKSSGRIVVQTAEVKAASEYLTEAMIGPACLNAEEHPNITFEVSGVKVISTENDRIEADVTGDFTLNGVTKPMTVRATATHLPGAQRDRGGITGAEGDLLVVRSKFKFNRADYNVMEGMDERIVGPVVEVDLATVGVYITNR